MHVEQRTNGRGSDSRDHVGASTFTDVHDAFKQGPTPDAVGESTKGTVAAVNLGAPELLIVLLVILVLFGGAKLPKLARSMGQAQSEFKRGLKEPDKASDEDDKTD
jgi:sec-independent protein translocase protein TatA